MVDFNKQFGGASGAGALEAKGAVVDAAFLGRMAMDRSAVLAVAAQPAANTPNAPAAKK